MSGGAGGSTDGHGQGGRYDALGGRTAKRGKPSTTPALKAMQVSTASLGRLDRLREG